MATRLQQKDIVICAACNKPVTSNGRTVRNKLNNKEKWVYHASSTECANAPELSKDWRRHGGTNRDNGFGTDILRSDGHTGYPDNDMSVRFEGVESQDNI